MRTRGALLASQTTALGLMMAFLVVPASALFLDEYGAGALPWTYLVVAAAGVTTSTVVSRAGRRLSLASLAAGLVTCYLVIVGGGWLALALFDAVWATFVLVVLFPLAIPVGFVAVGSQAVRLFDVRELKAQFPRVVAGFPLGFALGGLAAGLVAGALGAVMHLLLLGLLSGLGMLVLVRRTAREFPAELLTRPELRPPAPSAVPQGSRTGPSVLRDSLVASVLGYQVLSGAVTQLLDYIVWERAAAQFTDPESLARFQGLYGSALNVASIVFVGLAASWLLRSYGVRLGLAANPALVMVACLVMIVVGERTGIVGLGFLTVACLAQVADITTTDGLTRGSVAATYQAMPPERRLPAQSLAEGAGTPVAIGLVGTLLLLAQALDLGVRAVVWLVLGLTTIWLALAFFTYRSYGRHLSDVLRHRAWDPRDLRIHGSAAEDVVRRLLQSTHASDRMTGLEALADSDSVLLEMEVSRALEDPDPVVRRHALELVGSRRFHGQAPLRSSLTALLAPSPEGVRAAALLIGRKGEVDGEPLSVWTRALNGQDAALAEAAVAGAATAPHRSFLPHLLQSAGEPDPPLGIHEALAAHAPLLGPALISLWPWGVGSTGAEARRRAAVIRAVAGAGRSEPRRWLLARLREPDLSRADLRLIVDALAPSSWARRPATVPASVLAYRLEVEAGRVRSALVGLDHLTRAGTSRPGDAAPQRDLAIAEMAFRDELGEATRHVAVLFGATACPHGTAWFVNALAGAEPQLRAAAIELTEATLGRRRGAITVAVLDPTLDDAGRLASLSTSARSEGPVVEDPVSWLAAVAVDAERAWDSPWLQASVLRCLPALGPGLADRAARTLVDHPDHVVAETAKWVVHAAGTGVPELSRPGP